MRHWLALGCAAALVTVAACSRGAEEAPPPANDAEAAVNASNASAAAPVTDVAALMHDRHERYEEIGDAMKGIGNQLKADSPSLDTIRGHAALIARYASQVVSWFPPGTGPETGRRTRAKAEIWTDFDTFRQRAQAFDTEAARFHRTAQGDDVQAIRAGHGELGKACKNCHDRFRGPEIEH